MSGEVSRNVRRFTAGAVRARVLPDAISAINHQHRGIDEKMRNVFFAIMDGAVLRCQWQPIAISRSVKQSVIPVRCV
jgi:hypothetical protein